MADKSNHGTDGEIPLLRWSNRRRMAWWAFICLVAGTSIFWFILPVWFMVFDLPTTWLSFISETYSWFASAMTIIISAYMGFNSIANRRVPIPGIKPSTPDVEVDYDNSDQDEEIYEPTR